jgi:hypothetical protein
MLKKLIGNIPDETGFTKQYRFHQGWWRAFVLDEEQGMYWDEKNMRCKSVCNRLNEGERTLKNFLSRDIAETVKEAVEENKRAKSGMMDEDRLYNNLLSSQPLAFNFFGFFNANHDIALAFLRTIHPELTSIEEVVFEFSPKSTKDNSAFDIGFMVKSETRLGFIGFECKYTDTFSYRRKGGKVNYGDKSDIGEDNNYQNYFKVYTENHYRFPDDYFSYVRDNHYNQLFRNELLAVQLKSDFDFIITGLFCHHDDKPIIKAGKEFQKKIGNGNSDFILLTYADYFERIQKLELTWELRELVMLLWARYCGLKLSNAVLNNH